MKEEERQLHKRKMFKYKVEARADYTGWDFCDKRYPVTVICPNNVFFKFKKLHLI